MRADRSLDTTAPETSDNLLRIAVIKDEDQTPAHDFLAANAMIDTQHGVPLEDGDVRPVPMLLMTVEIESDHPGH
jgi:hypothetical protein